MNKEILGICPKCEKSIIENKSCYYCEDKECGFRIFKTICGAEIDTDNLEKLLNKKETIPYNMVSAKGNNFKAKLKLNKDLSGVDFVFVQDEEKVVSTCPKCNSNIVSKDGLYGNYYKCVNCNFKVSGIIAKTTITEEILKELIENRTTKIMNFKSKEGKNFAAKLILDSNNDITFDFNK